MGPRGYPGPPGRAGVDGPQGPPGPPAGGIFVSQNKDSVTLPAGCPVTQHSSGVGVVRAWAVAPSLGSVGLVQVTSGVGFAVQVQTAGSLTLADWSLVTGTVSLAARAWYFLDPVTPGMLTVSPPVVLGQILQLVGVAVSPDTLEIRLEEPILL